MGANHPGEIRDLCAIAQPDAGLITNVGKAHLEGFGSLEGVARAKGELFAYLMASGKSLFLNEGNTLLCKLVPENYRQAERYNGTHSLKVVRKSSNPFLTLAIVVSGREETLETRLLGQYNAENVLAACSVGLHYGIPFPDIRDAIAAYTPQNNRSQLIETARNRLYMDAYNANPSSMRAALEEFLGLEHPRKMLVLGEMRELGASSREEHAALARYIREHFEGPVYCIGKSFGELPEREHFTWFETSGELAASLTKTPPSDYFILIKGSRSNQLEKIAAVL
jgi:UDP-N-acetylmuramoyl-tripeptide--D-alanyl-D-alanine ligase